MVLEQALMEEKREYRKMRRLYVVTDERTQMAKIRYLQMKDDTQRFICGTLHEDNGIVMQKLKEDGKEKDVQPHKEVNAETGAKRHEYQDFK